MVIPYKLTIYIYYIIYIIYIYVCRYNVLIHIVLYMLSVTFTNFDITYILLYHRYANGFVFFLRIVFFFKQLYSIYLTKSIIPNWWGFKLLSFVVAVIQWTSSCIHIYIFEELVYSNKFLKAALPVKGLKWSIFPDFPQGKNIYS